MPYPTFPAANPSSEKLAGEPPGSPKLPSPAPSHSSHDPGAFNTLPAIPFRQKWFHLCARLSSGQVSAHGQGSQGTVPGRPPFCWLQALVAIAEKVA